MKFYTFLISITFTCIMTAGIFQSGFAQDNIIIKETRELPEFTGIDVGGAFDVYIQQGEEQSVVVETETKYIEKIFTKVENDILKISSKSIKSPSKLNIYISIPKLDLLWVSGAADVQSQGQFNVEKLKVECSGASSLDLELTAQQLDIIASGASDIALSGNAGTVNARASGAASIDCSKLIAADAKADASGAADIDVTASNNIIIKTSGAGTVNHNKTNKTVTVKKNSSSGSYVYVNPSNYSDTTRVKVGGIYVEVVEDDSVTVTVGNRVLIVNEDGNVRLCRSQRIRFNGHWGGFAMSINGYVNQKHNMQFPREEEYLDLRMEKSLGVYFNIIEQNIALTRNKKFGLITGLGMELHYYRFLHQTTLLVGTSQLEGFLDAGISVKRSRLVANYFVVPLIFEWQTHQGSKWKRFHINGGVVLKARFSSHTTKYYNELNKQYYLTQYDTELDQYVPRYETVSPGINRTRNRGDLYLNPFQLDATVGLGIGIINLFGQFGVLPMFRDNKAPVLYTWSAGIILIGW